MEEKTTRPGDRGSWKASRIPRIYSPYKDRSDQERISLWSFCPSKGGVQRAYFREYGVPYPKAWYSFIHSLIKVTWGKRRPQWDQGSGRIEHVKTRPACCFKLSSIMYVSMYNCLPNGSPASRVWLPSLCTNNYRLYDRFTVSIWFENPSSFHGWEFPLYQAALRFSILDPQHSQSWWIPSHYVKLLGCGMGTFIVMIIVISVVEEKPSEGPNIWLGQWGALVSMLRKGGGEGLKRRGGDVLIPYLRLLYGGTSA